MDPLTITMPITPGALGQRRVVGDAHLPELGSPASAVSLELSERALQEGQNPLSRQEGVAGLLTLVQTWYKQAPSQLSPAQQTLLSQVGSLLQPFVLDLRQDSDARTLRRQALHSGIFLENNLGAAHAGDPPPLDMKLVLFQILNLLQPQQAAVLHASLPGVGDGKLPAARSLLKSLIQNDTDDAAATEAELPMLEGLDQPAVPLHQRQLQAYLQNGAQSNRQWSEPAFRNWLTQQAEDSLAGIVQHQLRCGDEDGQRHWFMELLMQQRTGVLSVPLQVSTATDRSGAPWTLRFHVELPSLGRVDVAMVLDGRSVSLSLQQEGGWSDATRRRHRQTLANAFADRGLYLHELTHAEGPPHG